MNKKLIATIFAALVLLAATSTIAAFNIGEPIDPTNPYDPYDPIDPPDFPQNPHVITPKITNNTGGTNYTTGTPTHFSMTITHYSGTYNNFTWLIYDNHSHRITRMDWDITKMATTTSVPAISTPHEPPAPTYTFTIPGEYHAYIIPRHDQNNTLQWHQAAYQQLVVEGETQTPQTQEPQETGFSGLCMLLLLLVFVKIILVILLLTNKEKTHT